MDSKEFKVPVNKVEWKAFCDLHADAYTQFDSRKWTVFYNLGSGDALVVLNVTPRQIRLALNATGLRTTVENAVKAGDQGLKDWWEYALDIERDNALVVGMAQQLGITEQQIDDLFRLAATL